MDEQRQSDVLKRVEFELNTNPNSRRSRAIRKLIFASLGAIPWVGGVISSASGIPGQLDQEDQATLRTEWLREHEEKLRELEQTLGEIMMRFDSLGDEIDERIESPEFLSIVRQSFKVWDNAETNEKRKYVANMITNSAGTNLCTDDVIRLFVSWLDLFHESHFMVIREIHQQPRSTRGEIWGQIHGGRVREDSADADLFKLLVRDLSTCGVIRQERATTGDGQFIKQQRRSTNRTRTMTSAFDDDKRYVLTELGKQFVHYTLMSEVTRLEKQ